MSTPQEVFLARQPILDRQSRVAGYEVLYRDSADARSAHIEDESRVAERVMRNVFRSVGAGAVLGSHRGFFNVSAEVLESPMIEHLPRDRVVLEILESVPPTPDIAARCRQLKERGFVLALDDYVAGDAREPLVDLVEYVKLDLPALREHELPALVERLARRPLRLVAEKVETRPEFERCRRLGFHLFQGYYFARPANLSGTSLDPVRAALIELLRMLARGASAEELAAPFRLHGSLGVALLRIANAEAPASSQRIGSIPQALATLDEARLRRWLAILLFAEDDLASVSTPLLETAALRGRLLELLVRGLGSRCDPAQEGCAFLTGMLSLADVLVGLPRSELIPSLRLAPEITAAIVDGEGVLGEILALAEALERADFGAVAERLASLGICPGGLAAAEIEACGWVAGVERAFGTVPERAA